MLKNTLTQKETEEIRKRLEKTERPIWYFDDDADGLASFLIFYKKLERKGKPILVRATPELTTQWIEQAKTYYGDTIFVLDIPKISQAFIDRAQLPIYWLDHHGPFDRTGINYYNPKNNGEEYCPTSHICYEVTQSHIWLAAVGCVGDWYLPEFLEELNEKHPGLIDPEIDSVEQALYETKLGKITRIFNFLLKGGHKKSMEHIKKLSKIEDPHDLLEGKTEEGKQIQKRFQKINKKYQKLLKKAKSEAEITDKTLKFIYTPKNWSFTSELSNELSHLHRDKLVIVGRKHEGQHKCSLRSSEKPIPPILEEALSGLEGSGGGHPNACGAVIDSKDFEIFLKRLKDLWKNQ